MIKCAETSNWLKIEEEKDKRIKNNWTKKLSILTDLEVKWKMKDKCNRKREDKSVSISKRCFLKTRQTRRDKRKRTSAKELMILKPKTTTPKCYLNKKMIDKMKWSKEKLVHKNLWIKWLTTCWWRWNKNKSSKTKC